MASLERVQVSRSCVGFVPANTYSLVIPPLLTLVSRGAASSDNGINDTPPFLHELGRLCFTQLAELRHRGAFSAVAQTFATLCLQCASPQNPDNEKVLDTWYTVSTPKSTTARYTECAIGSTCSDIAEEPADHETISGNSSNSYCNHQCQACQLVSHNGHPGPESPKSRTGSISARFREHQPASSACSQLVESHFHNV